MLKYAEIISFVLRQNLLHDKYLFIDCDVELLLKYHIHVKIIFNLDFL
jgi:hypothetical protein